MRQSSKILLVICGVLLIYIVTLIVSVQRASLPEFGPEDATAMMNRLASAFDSSSTEAVLSFAAPDAKVAGRQLDDIRDLLHRAFGAMKSPHVEISDLHYDKQGETKVNLSCYAKVTDQSPNGYQGGGTQYEAHMGLVVQRIQVPRLWGLLSSYDWKITDVDAPHLPIPDATGP